MLIRPEVASLIDRLSKAELHVHLEGTLTPATVFVCARRNGVMLPWASEDDLAAAYRFEGLPDFLQVLFQVAGTLRGGQDFYDLALDYLRRAAADNVVRAEIFFGTQTFLDAGVPMSIMMDGVLAAIADARQEWGIDGALICTAQRHRDEASGLELLGLLEPWRDQIIGIGLGSAERGNPPSKFARYFANARGRGYRITVHAGEDGPADYVREALDVCRPDRIDHGVMIMSDPELVERIRDEQVPLTMCPLSNRALQVVPDLAAHPLAGFLRRGLLVTVNSDDPPFFGGYVNDNYRAIAAASVLSEAEIVQLARNSVTASFASDSEKVRYLAAIDKSAGGPDGLSG
ncbi:adenosine deaminase [Microlunatus endophyticus]|uniref:adenosine deaminase n=1 Tax=Microlunatus endophyticus TaxID=1716077 RepID=UPI001E5B391C|nr:adenosine deaminase [Microlunatus endophyticus]